MRFLGIGSYFGYDKIRSNTEIRCPVAKTRFRCDPEATLSGTQKTWYYLHKGLLNSAVISCASEFFPVVLVAHW